MGFRWRLFLGIGAAVLLTAGVYGALGYASFRRSLDAAVERELRDLTLAAVGALDLSGERPTLRPRGDSPLLQTTGDSRFRVVQEGRVLLEFGGLYPSEDPGWVRDALVLGEGYLLELALDVREQRRVLAAYLRTSLLALPVALGFAALLALLLQRYLLRPVRQLTEATFQLSRQAIPAPVKIPPGNDELSQLAESFNRMTDALRAFIDRERSFTRYASHELRTPLSTLKLLIEALQKGFLPPEEVWPKLDAAMDQMQRILAGLLALTRSPSINPEPILLELIVDNVVSALPPDQRERVSVVRERKESPIALGQDDLVTQVMTNLLHNALKYSPDHVVVRLEERGDQVLIRVRDFGPGVPEEVMPKLTDPFFRLDVRKRGLGLGLALVRHIVLSLGGTLQLNNVNPGFEAVVSLPRIEPPREDIPSREKIHA